MHYPKALDVLNLTMWSKKCIGSRVSNSGGFLWGVFSAARMLLNVQRNTAGILEAGGCLCATLTIPQLHSATCHSNNGGDTTD